MLLQPRGWTPDDGSRAFHGARAKVATRSGDIFLDRFKRCGHQSRDRKMSGAIFSEEGSDPPRSGTPCPQERLICT